MILRRITQHVKTQNWFAVGLDFVIVVFGVFIGLQVSNWNDARQNRADEAVFLQDLHNDLLNVSRQSARTEAMRFGQGKTLESAVELVFSDAPDRELLEAECGAIAYSHATYVGRARLPSLIQLQTAGRTGIISDRALARELAELTQRYEALGTVIREAPGTNIVRNYPDVFENKTVRTPAAGGSGELERDGETICELGDILSNRALLNDITYNADSYDAFMRDGFVPWVEQTRRVHERVDVLLGVEHDEVAP